MQLNGLKDVEVEIQRKKYGSNSLTEIKKKGFFK